MYMNLQFSRILRFISFNWFSRTVVDLMVLSCIVMYVLQAGVGKDGTLDYAKFAALTIHLQRMDNDEHLQKAFSHFDLDGNGFIDFDELKEALKEELSMEGAELINDIMNEVDIDKVSTSISFMFKGKTF